MHTALLGGLTLLGATFLAVNAVAKPVGSVPIPAIAFAVIGLIQLAFAFVVLRQRVPSRRSGQSSDDYWAGEQPRTAALALWAVIEGGGLFAWVGYLLTSDPAPAVVGALGLVALFMARPSQLEGE